jgi:hypothetical protein
LLRAILIGVVVGVSLPAWAGSSVGVVVTGDDSSHEPAKVAVETWLGEHRFAIAEAPLDKDASITLANCMAMADMACARGVVEKRSGAASVVVIVLQASGPKTHRDVQLSAYWITKNRDVVSLQRMCNHCKKDVLPKTVNDLMSDLSRLVPAMTAKVQITSTPLGLLAMIDGKAVGVTPVSPDVEPGDHVVSVMRDGKVLEKRTVTLSAGDTSNVSIVAPALPPPEALKPSIVIVHHSRFWPSVMVAGGLAAGGAASYMIVKGGPTGDSKYYTNYRTPGIGVAVGAGALAVTGTILLLRGSTTETPVAAITPGGAMVGWAGRF